MPNVYWGMLKFVPATLFKLLPTRLEALVVQVREHGAAQAHPHTLPIPPRMTMQSTAIEMLSEKSPGKVELL